ncbi:winged helix-turn-helix domain-containing protein [Shewanella xiamenensis]|uniref:winged helix-turn-helix domain-containing protein n=1 Tax=Shewanella xiamenensis TaxID=332186 RepID=UPI0021C0F020|nr:winged helix-turn-helix domain-containing protein [Shewanella xiamenensis]MCT8873751.1 winged helix-turn-helix domain-containing protein [Shewanella xiamenensis]
MQIKNLFESAYYRRLLLAYIIDEHGPISTTSIVKITGWPKNTVISNISAIGDLGIGVEFVGTRRTGGYTLTSWGPIKKQWIRQRYTEITQALSGSKER